MVIIVTRQVILQLPSGPKPKPRLYQKCVVFLSLLLIIVHYLFQNLRYLDQLDGPKGLKICMGATAESPKKYLLHFFESLKQSQNA